MPIIINNTGFLGETINKSKQITKSISDSISFYDLLIYILLPVLVLILFIVIYFNWEKLKKLYYDFVAKNNYVHIFIIHQNQKIISKFVIIDKFNNFKFRGKRYNMDDMHLFVTGYIKNIPVLFYDTNFILPLKLSQKEINTEIKKALNIKDDDIYENKQKITAFTLKVNPSVLEMVYDKKLISDLYTSVGDDLFKNPLVMYIVIGILIIIAWKMGLIDYIKELIGI